MTQQAKTKQTPPPPKKCLAAFGTVSPTDSGKGLGAYIEPIGFYTSKRAAKKALAQWQQAVENGIFLILETDRTGNSKQQGNALYQMLAQAAEKHGFKP